MAKEEPRFNQAIEEAMRKDLDRAIASPITPPKVKDSLRRTREELREKP
jgi:hypothetical protein